MCDYFEFAAGLGWTKSLWKWREIRPGDPPRYPREPLGGETSTGAGSAGPIPCNTVRSHPILSDPTRSQNFLPDPATSRSSPSFGLSRRDTSSARRRAAGERALARAPIRGSTRPGGDMAVASSDEDDRDTTGNSTGARIRRRCAQGETAGGPDASRRRSVRCNPRGRSRARSISRSGQGRRSPTGAAV